MLVERGRDDVKGETFYRLLGGTIEFGEPGAEALRRELHEELGTDVEVGELVATVENLFTYEGEPWHELVLVFECNLLDERLFGREEWEASETLDGRVVTHEVVWKPVDAFGSDGEIFYPEELLTRLRSSESSGA